MPLSTGESEPIGSIGGYTLLERLGGGGMGVVHLARAASGRQVAVKVVHDRLYFANRYGRLLALDRRTGAVRWTTDKLDDPGTSAQDKIPSVLLVKDAIVAVAGDVAFSLRPDRPKARPTPTATAN